MKTFHRCLGLPPRTASLTLSVPPSRTTPSLHRVGPLQAPCRTVATSRAATGPAMTMSETTARTHRTSTPGRGPCRCIAPPSVLPTVRSHNGTSVARPRRRLRLVIAFSGDTVPLGPQRRLRPIRDTDRLEHLGEVPLHRL